MQVLCFDIGGTDIKYGIVKDEKIIEKHKVPTEAHSSREYLEQKLYKLTKVCLE